MIQREVTYEDHVCEDPAKPYYRECHYCSEAFHKAREVLKDSQGHYWCDGTCIQHYEEDLEAEHEDRRYREWKDGGY
jgi:hypothetical protein